MSDKHLTELPWKMVAAKNGIKDTLLQKALAAYGKIDPAKVPQHALGALSEISELTIKLKKANAAKADVVDYLDEILKEIKRAKPPLEAKAGAAAAASPAEKKAAPVKEADEDDAEEEKEAAIFKKDIKKKLTEALMQVKARAPGALAPGEEPKPQLQFMVFLGGEHCAVVVARKVGNGTKKVLPEIAGGGTGTHFIRGECIFEKNLHTFVTEKVPPGLRQKLEKALHSETGIRYRIRVRSLDGLTVEESEEESGEEAKFKKRLAEFAPQIKANPQAKSGEKTVAVLAHEIMVLAGKKEFAKAIQALDLIEAALKQKPAPAGIPKPPPKPPEMTPARQIKLSTYLNGRSALRAARENSEKELRRLQLDILTKAADEPFLKEIETKAQRILDFLTPVDDSVANKLEEAGRCTDEETQLDLNQKARELIQKQLKAIRAHPLAGFVDSNPFGKYTAKQSLETALSDLDQKLS